MSMFAVHAGEHSSRSPVRQLSWGARWSLLLLLVTLPWRFRLWEFEQPAPPIYTDFTNLLFTLSDLFLLLLLLFWGSQLWLTGTRPRLGPRFIVWPLAGVVITAVFSVPFSVSPLLSGWQALRLILAFGLYLYIVNEPFDFTWLGWGVAGMAYLQAVFAITQVWQQADLGWQWLGERPLDPFGGSAFVWAAGGQRSLRAYGLTDHPNILGISLGIGLLLLLIWLLTANKEATGWMLWGVVSVTAVALLLTFSRRAWGAFAWGVAGVAMLLWVQGQKRPFRQWLLHSGWLLLILLPFAWGNLHFLRPGQDNATLAIHIQEQQFIHKEETALLQAANTLFIQHAVTGTGIGTFPLALQAIRPDFPYDYQPPRMALLAAAAEIGLFGALFYTLLYVLPWAFFWLNRQHHKQNLLLIGLTGTLIAWSLFALVDAYAWFNPAGRLWQLILWGVWAKHWDKKEVVHG
ncbi:MAG: hypothetical protein D6706_17505 [Chloroflexi bacterium]|nr:MAG: hypothetical protein D6706_17505 [Chloroflexota bacterium]